jgi:hypothetical protein
VERSDDDNDAINDGSMSSLADISLTLRCCRILAVDNGVIMFVIAFAANGIIGTPIPMPRGSSFTVVLDDDTRKGDAIDDDSSDGDDDGDCDNDVATSVVNRSGDDGDLFTLLDVDVPLLLLLLLLVAEDDDGTDDEVASACSVPTIRLVAGDVSILVVEVFKLLFGVVNKSLLRR